MQDDSSQEVTPGRHGAESSHPPLEDVYAELRRIAAHLLAGESPGQTLQPTALVHEAYMRLIGVDDDHWQDSRHFLNACALAMRRALIDRARRRKAIPARQAEPLSRIEFPALDEFGESRIEALDHALTELAAHNERWAEIAHLRFLLGLTIEQTARALDVSESTVKADWRFCSAWLRHAMSEGET